jgi:hypothetical protein
VQMMEKELTFSQLLDWIEGRLTEEEAAEVARLVESADSETKETVAWLRAFARIANEVVLASPPEEVREALVARFAGRLQPDFAGEVKSD